MASGSFSKFGRSRLERRSSRMIGPNVRKEFITRPPFLIGAWMKAIRVSGSRASHLLTAPLIILSILYRHPLCMSPNDIL